MCLLVSVMTQCPKISIIISIYCKVKFLNILPFPPVCFGKWSSLDQESKSTEGGAEGRIECGNYILI